MGHRSDLLELSPAVLTALANAGLVKRAQREVEQGKLAEPEVDDDGGVTVRCDDGSVVTLPPNSGIDGTCTCGANGLCRHRLGAVLRYQAWAAAAPVPAADTPVVETAPDGDAGASPETSVVPAATETSETVEGTDGPALPDIGDRALAEALPARTLTTAAALRRKGYLATVRPAGPDEDEPCTVELGTTTVRFLVGADLRYARCGCTRRSGCEHVALAAWAVQEARRSGDAEQSEIVVGVGLSETPAGTATVATADTAPADAVADLVAIVLRDGLANVGPTLALRLATTRRLAERASHGWVVYLVDRLADLHAAQERRAATNIGAETLDVLAGLMARYRATRAVGGGSLPAALVLGTDERSQTPLSQLRLTGLGASVRPGDEPGSCRVEVVLVDPSSATVLLARRTFRPPAPDTNAVPTAGGVAAPTAVVAVDGPTAARRSIVKGVNVGVLATGNLVSNAAVRRADRVVEFRVGGLRRTSVVGGGTTIDRFAAAGLVTEPDAIVAAWAARPPRLLRPLLATDNVVAIPIAAVAGAFFDPAEQRVEALIETPGGSEVVLRSVYRDVAPGAPAALARFAAAGSAGFVVGRATVIDGGVVVEPMLLASDTSVVPDLAPLDDTARAALAALPVGRSSGETSSVAEAVLAEAVLAEAAAALAELTVEGCASPHRWAQAATQTADSLRRAGLRNLADRLAAVVSEATRQRWGPADTALAQAWADAAIAVSVGRER